MVTEATAASTGLGAWRAQLLDRLLRVMLIAGTVVAIPSSIAAFASGYAYIAVVDLAAIGVIAVLTFATNVRYHVRVAGLLLTILVIGAALLPVVALVGFLFIGSAPIWAALLLERRRIWLMLALQALIMTIAGYVGQRYGWNLANGVDWPLE